MGNNTLLPESRDKLFKDKIKDKLLVSKRRIQASAYILQANYPEKNKEVTDLLEMVHKLNYILENLNTRNEKEVSY